MPQLTVNAARKTQGSFKLGPISTILEPGVTALLGANGAGKTTLMRLMVGTLSPSGGSVVVESGTPDDPHASVGYLPQDFAGPSRVVVRDYLEFVAWCRSTRRHRIRERDVSDALERVALTDQASSRIGSLSGGMVRRLGIAQAILGGSDVLVLDEPTVGLDPLQRADLRSLIADLSGNAVIVISTHLCEDVAAVASRVHVLTNGQTAFDGSVGALVERAGDRIVSAEAVERGFLDVLGAQQVSHVA